MEDDGSAGSVASVAGSCAAAREAVATFDSARLPEASGSYRFALAFQDEAQARNAALRLAYADWLNNRLLNRLTTTEAASPASSLPQRYWGAR
jgi:hypothetical protein